MLRSDPLQPSAHASRRHVAKARSFTSLVAVLLATGCGGPDSAELRTLAGQPLQPDSTGAVVLSLAEEVDVEGQLDYEGRSAFAATVITSNHPEVLAVQRLGGESFRLIARAPGAAVLELSFSAQGKATVSARVVAKDAAGR